MNNRNQELVLVVDDHDAGRYMAVRTLKTAGFRTLEAATGNEGLDIARREAPDLILLDIKLPDLDGFEVCRILRQEPRTASTAIIQTSATFETAEYQVRGLEGGADLFLIEPIEPTVLVANVRAMLRLRRAEAQLREIDRRKDEFLATVAHELRNPLAPLRYCLDMLEPDAEDPEKWAKCLQIMRRQTEHLTRLVEDLADMSRVAQNKLTLRLERLDLRRILETTIESRRSDIDACRHRLNVELPPERIEVHADAVRLTQMFGNILSNSVKYTPSEGRIAVSARLESDDVVAISFSDTGEGIEPDDLQRIFDLFVQVGSYGTGLGIGLALVNRIALMHGGSVEATSEGRGRGSTFIVRLPVIRTPGGQHRPDGPASQEAPDGSDASDGADSEAAAHETR